MPLSSMSDVELFNEPDSLAGSQALHISPGLGLTEKQWTNVERGARIIGATLTPPQEEIAELLCTRKTGGFLYQNPVVLAPRRVGKTVVLFSVLFGRCIAKPGYLVTYCAQNGNKTRERYDEMVRALSRTGLSGWKAMASKGAERIMFDNGSMVRFMPPLQHNFRGDASDVVVLDEAQEIDPEDAGPLLGAVVPMFDTRPGGGQLILAGTAGEVRSSVFWEALVAGRAGQRGIIEFAAPDEDDIRALFEREGPLGEEAIAVLEASHPGIGTLTTTEIIVGHVDDGSMTREAFMREYLGLWPMDARQLGLTREVWDEAGTEADPVPARYSWAYDLAPDRSRASVAAAWLDDQGVARVEVIETRSGSSWLAPWVHDHWLRTRQEVLYDAMGGAIDVAEELAQMRPRPELRGLTTAQYAAGCAAFVSRVIDGRLQHHRQPDLNRAIDSAGRRSIGDGLWGWSRKESGGPITEVVAATVALAGLTTLPPPRRRRVALAAAPWGAR